MLLGASGTGKELLARGLHDASDRADGPFIAINCAAIP
jgi:two-component system NtrC family response regulator